ncbi:MAG: DUF1016 domain-containing protein [Bacteroides sp.]|nr:DUF1016 domain-containing protein [Bacteroides sp.]
MKTISEKLSKELPGLKGFSERSLKNMRMFYEEWSPIIGSKSSKSSATIDEIDTGSLLPVKSSAMADDLERFLNKFQPPYYNLDRRKEY